MKKILVIIAVVFVTVFAYKEAKAQSDSTFSVSTSANPFEEQIIINIVHANKNVTGLRIVDAIGREVSSDVVFNVVNRGSIISYTLDFTNVRPGVYFCSIYSDKGILETRKLFRAAR
jgi:hypothetical protein